MVPVRALLFTSHIHHAFRMYRPDQFGGEVSDRLGWQNRPLPVATSIAYCGEKGFSQLMALRRSTFIIFR